MSESTAQAVGLIVALAFAIGGLIGFLFGRLHEIGNIKAYIRERENGGK